MQKLKYLLLVMVSVLVTLTYVISTSQASTFRVGFLFGEFHMSSWKKDKAEFSRLMKAEGIELYSVSARGSADLQVAQMNQMINDGFDAIVIVPINDKKLKKVLKRAHENNIKVIAFDKMIHSGYIDGYVGVNLKTNIKQARDILNITKSGNYIFVVNGLDTDFYKNLEEEFNVYKKKNNNNNIAVHIYIIDKSRIKGSVTQDLNELLTQLKSKVSGIFTYDDNIANNVIKTLHRNNIYSVYVTGKNATKEGITNVLSGYQYSTLYRAVDDEARIAAKTVIALLKHMDIKNYMNLVFSNEYSKHIPASVNSSIYLTKKNIKSFVDNNEVFSDRILNQIYLDVKNNNERNNT